MQIFANGKRRFDSFMEFYVINLKYQGVKFDHSQEPITRSVQLPHFRATAFSQVSLFLDTPFPRKLLFLVTS